MERWRGEIKRDTGKEEVGRGRGGLFRERIWRLANSYKESCSLGCLSADAMCARLSGRQLKRIDPYAHHRH